MEYLKLFFCTSITLNIVFAQTVTVEVEQGVILGEQKTFVTGNGTYYSFMSIPYAVPPVGPLRFRDPVPLSSWEDPIDATVQPPDCPQSNDFEVPYTSEDCLYLNVYTPNVDPEKPLPVMFFIHGGGFFYGSGNFYKLGPDFLVNKDVILVTINYRLGPLGFLVLDIPEVPGNAGLKDQVVALRWVKNNIARFGGDPDNITVFGQSVGAWSTGLFMISPITNGLFKRGILMSGYSLVDYLNTIAPVQRSINLGLSLGSNTTDPKETFKFLTEMAVDDIIKTETFFLPIEAIPMGKKFSRILFSPVVENDFGQERLIPDTIFNMLKNDIPQKEIIYGHTDVESLIVAENYDLYMDVYNTYPQFFVPFGVYVQKSQYEVLKLAKIVYKHYFGDAPRINNDTVSELSRFISDLVLNNNWPRFVKRLPPTVTVFTYIFSCVSERNLYLENAEKHGLSGAGHEDDLNYVFNPYYRNLTLDIDSSSYKMIQQITTLFTNFARFGNPTPTTNPIQQIQLGVKWPPFDFAKGSYLMINKTLEVGIQMDEDLRSFWQYFYEIAGFEY